MSRDKTKAVTPRLRFPEFRDAGPWEVRRLGDVCEINPPSGPLPLGFVYIDLESVEDGKLIQRKVISQNDAPSRAQRVLRKGDVVYQMVRPYQKNNLLFEPDDEEGYVASTGYAQLRAKGSNVFLYQLIYTELFTDSVIEKCTGSNYPAISSSGLAKVRVVIPSLSEQQKIADCLSSLDDLIRAEASRLEALQAHKKGLMQQLFPVDGETTPRLRFPEFRDAGPWEVKRLGEIGKITKGKGISKSDITPNGATPCIRYGELYTLYDEVIREVASSTNADPEGLVLSKEDDVIIPASGETKEDIATASCVTESGVALGGDLNIFRSSLNGEFFAYYVRGTLKPKISMVAQGDSVVHLYPAQLEKLQLAVPPTVIEQQKIADCLSSLDDLIRAQGERIEVLKQHKKGLMQQLFPSLDEVRG